MRAVQKSPVIIAGMRFEFPKVNIR